MAGEVKDGEEVHGKKRRVRAEKEREEAGEFQGEWSEQWFPYAEHGETQMIIRQQTRKAGRNCGDVSPRAILRGCKLALYQSQCLRSDLQCRSVKLTRKGIDLSQWLLLAHAKGPRRLTEQCRAKGDWEDKGVSILGVWQEGEKHKYLPRTGVFDLRGPNVSAAFSFFLFPFLLCRVSWGGALRMDGRGSRTEKGHVKAQGPEDGARLELGGCCWRLFTRRARLGWVRGGNHSFLRPSQISPD